MEAIKPKSTNQMATIIAYAEKDRTGVLAGRSFASPTFQTICAPLLGLLGHTQAQIKTSDEVANDDAEAIEQADHAMKTASEELARTFAARIELADTAAALKKIGDGITPQIKAKMLPADLASVREKYQRRLSALPSDSGKAVEINVPEVPKPDVSELTADEAGARLKGMLDERTRVAQAEAAMLDSLKAEAHEKAKGGFTIFSHWANKLSKPEAEILAPYMDSFRMSATYADNQTA
jgi:hypothetical protein